MERACRIRVQVLGAAYGGVCSQQLGVPFFFGSVRVRGGGVCIKGDYNM